MVAYPASSFVVSLLVEDGNSGLAKRCVLRDLGAICITSFSRCEVQHAIRTLAFKKQITNEQMIRSLLRFEEDQTEGFFLLERLDMEALFLQAGQLSNRYALITGVRYLDMLHAASAQLLKAERFLTFDVRQRKLAETVGLDMKI